MPGARDPYSALMRLLSHPSRIHILEGPFLERRFVKEESRHVSPFRGKRERRFGNGSFGLHPGAVRLAPARSRSADLKTTLGDCVMSLHLVAGIDFPRQLPTATAPYFLLGVSSRGAWVIRETTGRRAGLFRTRQAAIKYARDESPNGNFTILHRPEGLELNDSLRLSEAA